MVFWSWREKLNFLSVKVRPKGMEETLVHLERQWKRFVPNRAFSYQFLDEKLDGFYAQVYRFARVFRFAFGIAIALASLGLLGLAAFASERRRKEVGVRKVLGADISSVVGLLAPDFMKPVLLANLIAWPVAYCTTMARLLCIPNRHRHRALSDFSWYRGASGYGNGRLSDASREHGGSRRFSAV